MIRVPNELKLMLAEELAIHDLNALARTCRLMNEVLTRLMYGRAKDLREPWSNRPYFLQAVDDGNLTAVERFVGVGADVDMTDTVTPLPETAIHSCAHFGHVEMAAFLIGKGIDVSAVEEEGGRGALHCVLSGVRPEGEAMATLLVEAGADVDARRDCGETPLHVAARKGNLRMVRRLLDLGADPDAVDEHGSRPVQFAAAGHSGAVVRCLLEAAGQNVDLADNYGATPLHDAAELNRAECVEVLLEMGADVSVVDATGCTPLLVALHCRGNEASVHRILHLGASIADDQPFFRETYADCVPSCRVGEPNPKTIEALLAAGSDITKLNHHGISPLAWAAARAHTTSFSNV